MSDRVHGRVDILDSLAGNRRAADQNDRNPEAACRREFGVGGGTAAVLGEDDLHAETFEQRAFSVFLERTAIEDVFGPRHGETRLGSNRALAGMKHLNRLEQVMARMEWDDPQIAEGLMSDQKGRIVEGISTNLFLVSGGRLLTPAIEHCGVAGVMRAHILQVVAPQLALHSEEIQCERALLSAAQEVFLCNAVIGVWPVRQLGTARWPLGPVTRKVQAHVAQFLAS